MARLPPAFLALVLGLWMTVSCAPAPPGLLRPNGVAVAADGTLYVMDRGNYRVVHLSAQGRFLDSFGGLGKGPDQIYAGWDIALDAAGNIYIGHLMHNAEGQVEHDGVKVFTPQGRFLREIGAHDYRSEEIPRNVYGLEIDAQGRIYTADFTANTVRVFDPQGELLVTFFGPGSGTGKFAGLNDVAVDDRRGLVYVVDNINSCVQQFTLTTTATGTITLSHRLTFGTYGTEPGRLSYPQYLVVDEESGRLYVCDMGNYRIQAFDPEGRFLSVFAPAVEIWQPMGLALDAAGRVYVADAYNNVIWVFEPDGRLWARLEGR